MRVNVSCTTKYLGLSRRSARFLINALDQKFRPILVLDNRSLPINTFPQLTGGSQAEALEVLSLNPAQVHFISISFSAHLLLMVRSRTYCGLATPKRNIPTAHHTLQFSRHFFLSVAVGTQKKQGFILLLHRIVRRTSAYTQSVSNVENLPLGLLIFAVSYGRFKYQSTEAIQA